MSMATLMLRLRRFAHRWLSGRREISRRHGQALGTALVVGVVCVNASSFANEKDGKPKAGQSATSTLLGLDAFRYVDSRWGAEREIHVYAAVPDACRRKPETCRVLIAMHGASRDAKRTRDVWAAHADAAKLLVFAPHFDAERFKTAWYQQGGISVAATADETTFAVIDRLFNHIREQFALPQTQYAIYGHSAGGQFVQRMHLLRPSPRVSHYLAANPGYYTLPEWRADKIAYAYPFTVVGQKDGVTLARAALARPMTLLLGDKDNDPNHFQLNNSAGAMAQGAHRFARGENFLSYAKTVAAELKVPFVWRAVVVPGVDHDNAAMAKAAATLLATSP